MAMGDFIITFLESDVNTIPGVSALAKVSIRNSLAVIRTRIEAWIAKAPSSIGANHPRTEGTSTAMHSPSSAVLAPPATLSSNGASRSAGFTYPTNQSPLPAGAGSPLGLDTVAVTQAMDHDSDHAHGSGSRSPSLTVPVREISASPCACVTASASVCCALASASDSLFPAFEPLPVHFMSMSTFLRVLNLSNSAASRRNASHRPAVHTIKRSCRRQLGSCFGAATYPSLQTAASSGVG